MKPLMQASDVTAKAANLRNKKYLMVHGTADDNVHYQQSMMLARAMEEADVLFRSVEQEFGHILRKGRKLPLTLCPGSSDPT